ncbi:MAG: tetratricopeptide repeat protein [Acidobacteriota bacterium]
MLKQFRQINPTDSRSYFYMGIALAGLERLREADSELSEAVRLAPQRPEYRLFQASVLTDLGQKAAANSALTLFETRKNVGALTPDYLWFLSDIYYRLAAYKNALDMLELLSQQAPRDFRADLLRGRIQLLRGNHAAALDSFEKSIEKKPTQNPGAHYQMGLCLYDQGQFASSKVALQEALRHDENNPLYLHKLGVVCLALNQVDQAIGYLEAAQSAATKFPEVYYVLARAYRMKGEPAKEEVSLSRFQAINASERGGKDRKHESRELTLQGEERLHEGNQVRARELFEQSVRIDPGNWDAHWNLAKLYLDSGSLYLAHSHLVKMEGIDSNSVSGSYLMAMYWYRIGNYERARPYGERVRSFRPADPAVRNLLGNIYWGLGRKTEALEEYSSAVRLAPDRADYRRNLETVQDSSQQLFKKAQPGNQ